MHCSSCGAATDGAASSCVRCDGLLVTSDHNNHVDTRAREPQAKRSSLIPLAASAALSFVSLIVILLSLPIATPSWLPPSRMKSTWAKSAPAIVRFSSVISYVPERKGEPTVGSDSTSEGGPRVDVGDKAPPNGAVPLPTRVANTFPGNPIENGLAASPRSSKRGRELSVREEKAAIKNMLEVGKSLYSNGDYDEAIIEFRRVLAQAPGNSLALEGISNAATAKATEQRILKR